MPTLPGKGLFRPEVKIPDAGALAAEVLAAAVGALAAAGTEVLPLAAAAAITAKGAATAVARAAMRATDLIRMPSPTSKFFRARLKGAAFRKPLSMQIRRLREGGKRKNFPILVEDSR